jgi:hypothetical protein
MRYMFLYFRFEILGCNRKRLAILKPVLASESGVIALLIMQIENGSTHQLQGLRLK